MIPRHLTRLFAHDVRARGDGYFRSGKVRLTATSANSIQALVRGTSPYIVEILAREDTLDLSCSCPYARDVGPCKHLWALLLKCDADRTLAVLLKTSGAGSHISFATDDAENEDYDADDDDALQPPDDLYPFELTSDVPPVRPRTPKSARSAHPYRPPPPPTPGWMRVIDTAQRRMLLPSLPPSAAAPAVWPQIRRLVYILDLDASALSFGAVIDLGTELRARDGTWGDAKRFTLGAPVWFAAPDPIDRQIAEMLCGSSDMNAFVRQRTSGFVILPRAFPTTLRTILDTGRCRLRSNAPEVNGRTMQFEGGAPWAFRVRVHRGANGAHQLSGILVRDAEEMSFSEPLAMSAAGFLITRDTVAAFDHANAFPLVQALWHHGPAVDGPHDVSELLHRLYALPHLPPLALPDGVAVAESHAAPRPVITFHGRTAGWRASQTCRLEHGFLYGSVRIRPESEASSLFDRAAAMLHHRQPTFEQICRTRLLALGGKEEWDYQTRRKELVVSRTKLMPMALSLAREGWEVTAEGVSYRAPGAISATVSSGIDWFDLSGSVAYGNVDVPIAAILDARRRGEEFVPVGDGAVGLMPLEWLEKLGPLIAAGDTVGGGMRYRRSQASLLDALLATLPDAQIDATFERARTELRTFERVAGVDPPASFTGTLREYQRDGLGWLHFLRRFGLGGCLADDMGLGKTVQVLALLETRRLEQSGPSIIVVPRSLVFNWLREAARFAPALRMLDFSLGDRTIEAIQVEHVDVVVTTYGSMRRDAAMLAGIEFDYAILDEAQAIKNASTASAKASRLLRARHRLVMTGTPIENRIEELWSLLEFLNPGMLGAAAKFAALARPTPTAAAGSASPDGVDGRALLARALRPLILRRTKEHVAPELPARIEQTLEVELEPKQRKFYDSILRLVRANVMDRVEKQGIQKSQLHILEALLRLRQAACHPALVETSKAALPSAKLDALIPALTSIAAEGHKSLVFSQFTEFLALVRERLDDANIPYEYLDGKTRDRQARVDRFQSDPNCPVFLISLKAGGHGLNLTAADYVYLLDPWWNPAVEVQAIDRAHRIGQSRRVIATRLVARDTIEAKILQLQSTKRALADAVLMADKGGLASIGRSELELLLG